MLPLPKARLVHADRKRGLLYVLAAEPGDAADAETVERRAHDWCRRMVLNGWPRRNVVPVENMVAPVDFSYPGGPVIRKGSWVVTLATPRRLAVLDRVGRAG